MGQLQAGPSDEILALRQPSGIQTAPEPKRVLHHLPPAHLQLEHGSLHQGNDVRRALQRAQSAKEKIKSNQRRNRPQRLHPLLQVSQKHRVPALRAHLHLQGLRSERARPGAVQNLLQKSKCIKLLSLSEANQRSS